MITHPLKSPVSVVVVSDYEDGQGVKSWTDERCILTTLADQDYEHPFDVVLVENEAFRDSVPDDLETIVPNLKIIYSSASRSADLKDFGVRETTTPLVAVLEADCLLSTSWLRVLVDVLQRNPSVDAVSGRTIYGRRTVWQRCFTLLDRGYSDLGRPGPTGNLSNNGALYRRELLEKYPFPEAGTPFISGALRLRDINRDGHVLYFEPLAELVHAFGWQIEKDLRRNRGFLHMSVAGKNRFRAALEIFFRKLVYEAWQFKRLGRQYLRWFDWPVAVVLLFVVRVLEFPGMIDAVKNRKMVPGSAYR